MGQTDGQTDESRYRRGIIKGAETYADGTEILPPRCRTLMYAFGFRSLKQKIRPVISAPITNTHSSALVVALSSFIFTPAPPVSYRCALPVAAAVSRSAISVSSVQRCRGGYIWGGAMRTIAPPLPVRGPENIFGFGRTTINLKLVFDPSMDVATAEKDF